MRELSLHILDIAMNSVRAKASNIEILVDENIMHNKVVIQIDDDGCGMKKELLEKIKDPFTTTRTIRKVGLGIPLLNNNCIQCDGRLYIDSKVGKGTKLKAELSYNHIDRPPLGDICSTIAGLITSNSNINIKYTHIVDKKEFSISTNDLKEILGDEVALSNVKIYGWLVEYLKNNILELKL